MSRPLCGEELKVQSCPTPHGPSLSTERPRQDRRDSGVSAVVRGGAGNCTRHPNGASLPPKRATEDRSEGNVNVAVWGGAERSIVPDPPNKASLAPKTARAGPEGLGAICRCVAGTWKSNHTRFPIGPPYPPNGLGKTRGTRVSPRMCGEELEVQSY